jgi:hypothetical protein
MLPISSQADMNSRATRQRSHRSRIRSRAVSGWDDLVEAVGQAEQSRVGHRFIPVVENGVERRFALGADAWVNDCAGRKALSTGRWRV